MFAVGGPDGTAISAVTVSGNTVANASIGTKVASLSRVKGISVTDNRSLVERSPVGPDDAVLEFQRVDGLKVSGNVQPRSSGRLVSVTDSTDVSTD